MKYIRTENGIYEIIDETENGYWSIYGDYFRKSIDIKQADTIAELCDGFYIDDGKQGICINDMYSYFNTLKHDMIIYYKKCSGKNYTGYGFIKTDKGFIYVAKMNSDGELELI